MLDYNPIPGRCGWAGPVLAPSTRLNRATYAGPHQHRSRRMTMDPLIVTAGVIAVATLALQSCKAAYNLADGLAEAPQAIARSKASLTETQKTLGALQQTLKAAPATDSELDAILRTIDLNETLVSAKRLCDEYTAAIARFTSYSTEGKFSKRDRLLVNLQESKVNKFSKELGDCQRTMSMVLASINLIVSTRTADDVRRIGDQFQAQEQALADLDAHLRNREASPASEEGSASDQNVSLQLTAGLRKVCQEALAATRAQRTGQKFGDMSTDDQSLAVQGIVGEAQVGVEQSFGRMTTSKNSKAFQGQINAASFAIMFGKG
ncbi:hypothetical protein DL764_008695 [Monosporascus ibericus]|uniref:Azaphilone pigments biosynthesis cluster protein L N-terminal domain-containing protein n=1 Tax=Monosporascus ibericus TaxID=155417 RepID=A0A4Q4SWX9_9PEZI|nr:hypothetical protein DL764_008695 [Monosporascus ibericus]